MGRTASYPIYRVIKAAVRLFYPKTEFIGTENLPDGPVVIVGNHAKMNAPIACELYLPGEHRTWTAGEMMHLKEVPAYAFADFWANKPVSVRWFYKGLSYAIAPVSVCVFNNADCIGVYHDSRLIGTFRSSIAAMHEGVRIVIMPERDEAHNNIVCGFSEKFVDVARMYYKHYKEEVSFVPMYVAPGLRKVYLGRPVKFDSSAHIAEERTRISRAMMDGITEIARELPEHNVVPYPNLPKRDYPSNRDTDKVFDSKGVSTAQCDS